MKSPKPPLKDSDSAETLFRFKALLWSGVGGMLGALFGVLYAARAGGSAVLYVILFGVGMWALVYFGTLLVSDRAGRAGESIYFGSGSSTPARREYSLAESLIARGQYSDALAEYERNIAMHPDDVELHLRIARLQRDSLAQLEAAASWYRRAIALPTITPALDALATRELVELLVHRMREPRRALSELARLADRHSDPAVAQWAQRELTELKRTSFREEQP